MTGVASIDRRLKTLLPRLQKKVIRQAMRKGLKVIQSAVKASVPTESGETRRNIKVRKVTPKKGQGRNAIFMEARIRTTDKLVKTSKAGKRAFYPAIVEYKFKHFMKRAYQAAGGLARKIAMSEIHAGIDREASKGP